MTEDSPRIGAAVTDWLAEQGLEQEATNHAIKRALAWQIEEAMKEQGIGKNQMAKRMRISRACLDRFLDPDNDKVQLDTMQRAAAALRRRVKLELA